jgi:hypothetical protein
MGLAVGFGALLAACGGSDAVEPAATATMTARQQQEAAALDKAMSLAREAHSAKVRGERARQSQ